MNVHSLCSVALYSVTAELFARDRVTVYKTRNAYVLLYLNAVATAHFRGLQARYSIRPRASNCISLKVLEVDYNKFVTLAMATGQTLH